MRNEDVVPVCMLLFVGIVLTLVGIRFGFATMPLWLYCPGLISMGIPMIICSLLMFKESKNLEQG